MKEILPGLIHWTVVHPKIGIRVHSYYLSDRRVLIDPLLPKQGIGWFREKGPPEHVLLTNRHHYRHSSRFREAFGVTVWCHRAGLHEFKRGQIVEPFEHGDELPGRILALEVGVLCPEETALYFRSSSGEAGPRGETRRGMGAVGDVLAFGDALIREDDELGFVPDKLMGENPEAVKRGLRRVFRRLLRRDFDHLLFAHGAPLIGGGKARLAGFVEA